MTEAMGEGHQEGSFTCSSEGIKRERMIRKAAMPSSLSHHTIQVPTQCLLDPSFATGFLLYAVFSLSMSPAQSSHDYQVVFLSYLTVI